jgi:hypothetical protein
MVLALADLASQYHIAIVAVNQMATKQKSTGNEKHNNNNTTRTLVLTLGEYWAHAVMT